MKEKVQASTVPEPAAAYSQGIIAEGRRILFISGQVPVDANGDLVGRDDMRKQARQVFENLQSQLRAAGADMGDVAKLTIFVTDMSQFSVVSEVRSDYVEPEYPAASTIEVSSLADPDWLLEIEAYAVLG